VDLNSKPYSLTHIQNLSFDEDKQLAVREIVGVDPGGVVRKVPVGTDGSLITSLTSLPLPTGAATSANQTLILNKIDQYNTNHIDDYTTASVTYICQEDKDGAWLIKKIDETGNYPVFTYATITNNPTVATYTDAFTSRVTLTYELFNQAF
jgi:hypothetical protein